ncbi:MAG: kelch repeat-containing protein [bacterium]
MSTDRKKFISAALALCCVSTSFLFASAIITEDSSDDFSNGEFNRLVISDGKIRCGNNWSELDGTPGPLREFDIAGEDQAVLFGGISSTSVDAGFFENKTYVFNVESERWEEAAVSPAPSARVSFAMSGDGNGNIVLFGGFDGVYCDDTWIFSTTEKTWEKVNCSTYPSARIKMDMAKLTDGTVLLFGGYRAGGYFSDTWSFDTTAKEWSLLNSTGPSARADYGIAGCGDGKVVFFGGSDGSVLGDTWIFEGGLWTDVSSLNTAIKKREGPEMTYDTDINRVILFSGKRTILSPPQYPSNIWIFNPQDDKWKEITAFGLSPSGRKNGGFCYLKNYGNILFGGEDDNGIFSDLWKFVISSSGAYVSKVYDTGISVNPVEYKNISWEGVGNIKFQLAASTGLSSGFVFMGHAGENTFYETSGSSISFLNGKRFVKAKLFFECEPENVNSRYLSDFSVGYNHKPEQPSYFEHWSFFPKGSSISETKPMFKWKNCFDADNDAHTYEILVSTADDFSVFFSSAGILEQTGSPERSFYISEEVLSEGKYFWKVRAGDDYGYGEFSETWNFYIDTSPPAAVTDLTAEKIVNEKGTIKLSWTAPGDDGASGDIVNGLFTIKYKPMLNIGVWEAELSEIVVSTSVSPGDKMIYKISGLQDGTSYFFAVCFEDEAFEANKNLGGISNNAFAWTDSAPSVSIAAPAFYEIWRETGTIKWESADVDAGDEIFSGVFLSTNNGTGWFPLAENLPTTTTLWFFNTFECENSTTCLVKITARDTAGLETAEISPLFEIRNENFPPEVKVMYPSEGQTVGGVFELKWSISDRNLTDSHTGFVYISTDNLTWENLSQSDESALLVNSVLYQDNTYFFKILVQDNRSPPLADEASVSAYLRNENHPPASFSLLEPEDESIVNFENITFRWEEAQDFDGDDVSYVFCYSTDSVFCSSSVIKTADNFLELNLEDTTEYFWKVQALDSKGSARDSEEGFSFFIKTGSLTVVGIYPQDGGYAENVTVVTVTFNRSLQAQSVKADNVGVFEKGAEISAVVTQSGGYKIHITAVFTPSKEYTICLSENIKDADGNPLTGQKDFGFKTLLSAYTAGTLEFPDENITVGFSSGSAGEPCFVSIERDYTDGAPARNILEKSRSAKFINDFCLQIKALDSAENPVQLADVLEINFGLNAASGFVGRIPAEKIFVLEYRSDGADSAVLVSRPFVATGGRWEKCGQVNEGTSIKIFTKDLKPFALAGVKPANSGFASLKNYPNPFSKTTAIWFDNPQSSVVTMKVFALTGEEVFSKNYPAAGMPIEWDGKDNAANDLPDGMYVLFLETAGNSQKKLVGILR